MVESSQKPYETLLVIDGAYLKLGAREKEIILKREVIFTDNVVRKILDFMQERSGTFIDEKVFISAERDDPRGNDPALESKKEKKRKFRQLFINNGFTVDMRSFKNKKAYCPNSKCQYASKGKG